MRRSLLCLLLLTASASAGEIKIAWWGQSMFEIVTPAGKRLVLDPHNLDAYRVRPMKADLVLMSHLHNDHTRMDVIENAKDAKQYNALKKSGDGDKDTEFNLVKETLGDIKFESLGTYHDESGGLTRGKNGCWIMDIDGVRIVHLGDLGHTLTKPQLKKLGKVDVLMIPVGGVYTLNGITAQKVVEQVKPARYVIPMHYGTAVYDDLLYLKYFTDEQPEGQPTVRQKPLTWFKVDTKAKVPEKYTYAILDYQGSPPVIEKKKDKGKDKEPEKDKDAPKDK
ncbi:MAG: MBL fold metallo-hydrolase [Gemmataceae bacterium]|nr:MBL fold metallo-hydrolase [Gemmataceae bacterium]